MPGAPIRLRTVTPESHVVSAKRNGIQVRLSSTRSQRGIGRPARSPIQPATRASLATIHAGSYVRAGRVRATTRWCQ
jgi:hypothetical protein